MAYIYKEDKGSNQSTKTSLQKLEDDIKNAREIEMELARVWDKVRSDAFMMCPKDTWSLANTIRVVKTPMGTTTGDVSSVKSVQIFDRTIVAGDLTKINPKTKQPINYGVFVHDGYIKDGVVHNGVPFLTNAIAQNEDELMQAVNRALAKLGKKYETGGA